MKKPILVMAVVVIGAGLMTLFDALFTVDVRQQAIVLQFGELKRTIKESGLHFKVPFAQNVIYMDQRILSLDLPKAEVIASDEKRLEVDALVRFRIFDPVQYYKSVQGDEVIARARLSTTAISSLRRVLGSATFSTLLTEERAGLMAEIRDLVDEEAANFGLEIIDVRIKRADLPEQVSTQVFERMKREFNEQAAERRATGQEQAQRIRADADRQRQIILAEAGKQGDILRGEGDGEAVRIFADAFGRDIAFFEFYRSMQAYQKTIGSEDTMIMSPDSQFFKYLNQSGATK